MHRRLISPLLAPCFAVIALCALLLGALERRGLTRRIVLAIALCVTIEGLYLGAFSIARSHHIGGLILMYLLVLLPLAAGLRFLMLGQIQWSQLRFWERFTRPVSDTSSAPSGEQP